MKRLVFAVLLLTALIATACGPAAPAEPTEPPTEAAPEATEEPTEEAAEAPTATPTEEPTEAPTVETEPTITPTATMESIVGEWAMWDVEAGGYNWFTFNEDGSLRVAHGGPDPSGGIELHVGQYSVEGGVLTFLDGFENVCPDNPEATGTYLIRLGHGGDWLRLDKIEDACIDRDYVFNQYRMDRWEP